MKHTVTQHLLYCLNEECLEVAKEVDKSLRFGIDDTNFLEPSGPNNRERIVDELNDLMGVISLCVETGIIPEDWRSGAKEYAKRAKVIDCMDYARSIAGTLQ